MRDGEKTREQLIEENAGLRRQVAVLEADVAQRHRAEEALRVSEERYRTLAESTTDIIYILDETGTLLYANQTAAAFMGLSPDALVGRKQEDLFPPDQVKLHQQRIRMVIETGEMAEMEQLYRLGQKDVWLSVRSIPLRDRQGRVTSVMGVCRNITARKLAEEALQKAHDKLERRVEERTAKLTQAHRTLKHLLQSSDRERQLIAYEIHDGLAQQLAGAIMQFEVFHHLRQSKPADASAAYETGMTLLRQGHFETRRLIAGVRPPILDESGVAEAISHLVLEQGREGGPKIEFFSKVDFDRLVPTLENAIYRICQEALANACQHSKSKTVRVSLLQRKDRVRIVVRDWGVGFDAKAVRDNRYGLEGIRQRARLLGGKCSIRSRTGRGTLVMVELPVVERDEGE